MLANVQVEEVELAYSKSLGLLPVHLLKDFLVKHLRQTFEIGERVWFKRTDVMERGRIESFNDGIYKIVENNVVLFVHFTRVYKTNNGQKP